MPSILKELEQNPHRFDFLQVVRILSIHANAEQGADEFKNRTIGVDNFPDREVIRFRTSPTLRNRSGPVVHCKLNNESGPLKSEITVSFLGLIGATGVLPRHYTQTVINRVKEKDNAMRDFFDLFHHRIISNFYRASLKYRLPLTYEVAQLNKQNEDPISNSLYSLVGFNNQPIRNQQIFADRAFVYYGGHFSDGLPTSVSLKNMLEEFAGLPVEILQFQFEWLYLDVADQSRLSNDSIGQLGSSIVIGERVGSIQNRFRIRMGPVNWKRFAELTPSGTDLNSIAQFVKTYVGIDFDFDFQISIRGEEIPPMILGDENSSQLGWTTWLNSAPPDGLIEDAVFSVN